MSGIIAWAKAKRAKLVRRVINASKRFMVLAQYQYINSIDESDKQIRLMNYGWIDPASPGPLMPLDPEDEQDRHSLQLYHRVAAAVDLRDKDVLEIGCGRGGGAVYMMKYLAPRTLVGLDFCPSTVKFCNEQWNLPGLSFAQGFAERLKEQEKESFDAVVNVEIGRAHV